MLEILPLAERHLAQVTALEAATFSEPWSESAFRGEMENPNSCFLVAEEAGEVLGYLGMQLVLDEGYITNVAVAASRRRQGIGARLMEAAIAIAREERLALLTLEVRVSNRGAIALYERYGFQAVGRRRGFYRFPREDAFVMTMRVENP